MTVKIPCLIPALFIPPMNCASEDVTVLNWSSLFFVCYLLTTMGENETSSSVQEMNIQEVKDFIAKEFQLEIAEKFEGKLVSHCVFRAILHCV